MTGRRSSLWFSVLSVPLWLMPSAFSADPLPGTKPLTEQGDLARKMVDGIHAYLDRELAAAPGKRDGVKPNRDRLRKLLGVVDERVPLRVETFGPTSGSARVRELGGCSITRPAGYP